MASQDRKSDWAHISSTYNPVKTFLARSGLLTPSVTAPPPPGTDLHQVIIRKPSGRGKDSLYFGPLSQDSIYLLQHGWLDGTLLLHTSTAQLRHTQAQHKIFPHTALLKWQTQLAIPIPTRLWNLTWLNFRSASENTFLWQLIYRVIATQRWRFPTRSNQDISTWCTRCSLGLREDITHCIWACPLSTECWQWGETLLTASSRNGSNCSGLLPSNVFLADPLPEQWQVPERFWQILRAVVCRQIWKDRNSHYLADKPASSQRVIRKSWHRLRVYLHKEWRYLARKVQMGKMSLEEAENTMHKYFGSNPSIWNLHALTLQVPPVPPRPP